MGTTIDTAGNPAGHPTVRLSITALHRLLAPVLPFAGTDDMLPVLQTVHLEVHGRHLYAVATDRFKAGVHRVPAHADYLHGDKNTDERDVALKAAQGFEALVSTADLAAILTVWRPTRSDMRNLELRAVPNEHTAGLTNRSPGLVVADTGTADRTYGRRVTFEAAHLSGQYPKVRSLFADVVRDATKPGDTGHTMMNVAHYGPALAAAQSTLGRRGEGVTIRHGKKMTALYAGEDFVAIVMGRRRLDPDGTALPPLELATNPDLAAEWAAWAAGNTPAVGAS